jgi:hypothetical protein
MTEGELNVRTEANVRKALQRYMIVLMKKRRDEDDPLLRDLLSAEMMELDYWYGNFVDDEDVSLFDLAERKMP